MNLLFDVLKKISNYYPDNKTPDEKLAEMSSDQLRVEASKIMEENNELKRKISQLTQENNLLHNSIIVSISLTF